MNAVPLSRAALPSGWSCPDIATAQQLLAELKRELPPGHLLSGRAVEVYATCAGTDDVLFRHRNEPDRFTLVPLSGRGDTGANVKDPAVEFDGSFAEFLAAEERLISDDPSYPFPNVTKAGRVLILLTVAFSASLFVAIVFWINEHGPAGTYPIVFFACAIAPFAALFFGAGMLVFRALGLRFYRQLDGTSDQRPPIAQSTDARKSTDGAEARR